MGIGRVWSGAAKENKYPAWSRVVILPTRWACNCYQAWRWRRKLRRLLLLDELGLIRLGSARQQVEDAAQLSLPRTVSYRLLWHSGPL
jgi:hypothetical protein